MRDDHVTVVTPLLLSYGEIWVFWSTYDRICILITRIFHEAQVLIEKIRWIEARIEDLNVVVVCPIRTLFC